MDLNDFENKYIDTIDSKYKIIEKIGRGYSSKVFKVKQQDINTEIFYAAKVFKYWKIIIQKIIYQQKKCLKLKKRF